MRHSRLTRKARAAAYDCPMDITDVQLGWIMGCMPAAVRLGDCLSINHDGVGSPAEERVLGKLYWHLRTALDRRKPRG
jgi:hypothetical protein